MLLARDNSSAFAVEVESSMQDATNKGKASPFFFAFWYRNLSLRGKLLFALLFSEVISILVLAVIQFIITTSTLNDQLGFQGDAETQILNQSYVVKQHQMLFGFRGQSDNLAIKTLLLDGASATVESRCVVEKILAAELSARRIELSLLVDLDMKIVASSNHIMLGEVFNFQGLVQRVMTLKEQVVSSELITRDFAIAHNISFYKESVNLVPGASDFHDVNDIFPTVSSLALARLVITPVFNGSLAAEELTGILVAIDVVNGKTIIPERSVDACVRGFSTIVACVDYACTAIKLISFSENHGDHFVNSDRAALVNVEDLAHSIHSGYGKPNQHVWRGDGHVTTSLQEDQFITTPTVIKSVDGTTTGYLVHGTSKMATTGLIYQTVRFQLLAIGPILLFDLILASLLGELVIKPIKSLGKSVKMFSKGKFTERARVYSNDEVGHLCSTFNSMMERIEGTILLREEVQQSRLKQEAAEEADKAKSVFLARFSHEIRTPLNGILGVSNILLGTVLDEGQRELIRTLESSGQSLFALLNDIIDISKLHAGQIVLEKSYIDLYGLLEAVVGVCYPSAQEKGCRLGCAVWCGHLLLYQDEDRLRQILINLVSNAVRCTLTGEVLLCVSERESLDRTSSVVEFSIMDSGLGISEEEKKLLYAEREFRRGSGRAKEHGAGLGLSISRELVKLMDGRIEFNSIAGLGARFDVILTSNVRWLYVPQSSPAHQLPISDSASLARALDCARSVVVALQKKDLCRGALGAATGSRSSSSSSASSGASTGSTVSVAGPAPPDPTAFFHTCSLALRTPVWQLQLTCKERAAGGASAAGPLPGAGGSGAAAAASAQWDPASMYPSVKFCASSRLGFGASGPRRSLLSPHRRTHSAGADGGESSGGEAASAAARGGSPKAARLHGAAGAAAALPRLPAPYIHSASSGALLGPPQLQPPAAKDGGVLPVVSVQYGRGPWRVVRGLAADAFGLRSSELDSARLARALPPGAGAPSFGGAPAMESSLHKNAVVSLVVIVVSSDTTLLEGMGAVFRAARVPFRLSTSVDAALRYLHDATSTEPGAGLAAGGGSGSSDQLVTLEEFDYAQNVDASEDESAGSDADSMTSRSFDGRGGGGGGGVPEPFAATKRPAVEALVAAEDGGSSPAPVPQVAASQSGRLRDSAVFVMDDQAGSADVAASVARLLEEQVEISQLLVFSSAPSAAAVAASTSAPALAPGGGGGDSHRQGRRGPAAGRSGKIAPAAGAAAAAAAAGEPNGGGGGSPSHPPRRPHHHHHHHALPAGVVLGRKPFSVRSLLRMLSRASLRLPPSRVLAQHRCLLVMANPLHQDLFRGFLRELGLSNIWCVSLARGAKYGRRLMLGGGPDFVVADAGSVENGLLVIPKVTSPLLLFVIGSVSEKAIQAYRGVYKPVVFELPMSPPVFALHVISNVSAQSEERAGRRRQQRKEDGGRDGGGAAVSASSTDGELLSVSGTSTESESFSYTDFGAATTAATSTPTLRNETSLEEVALQAPVVALDVIRVDMDEAQKKKKKNEELPKPPEKAARPVRVLLFEDNVVNRKVTRMLLHRAMVECDVAEDGLIGLKILNERPNDYDAILMDVEMPNLDGYGATRAIRKKGYLSRRTGLPIPVIALTAHALSSDKNTCLESGMNCYITKPVRYELLTQTIHDWIGRGRRRGRVPLDPDAMDDDVDDVDDDDGDVALGPGDAGSTPPWGAVDDGQLRSPF